MNQKPALNPGLLLPPLIATIAGCASSQGFVADDLYNEPPPRAPIGANAAEVFLRAPWALRSTPTGSVRYHREAELMLPDAAETFTLREVSVYASDGSDVQLEYVSSPPGESEQSRAVIRVSVHRATVDLDTEWKSFDRGWHQRQTGTLTDPLPLPDHYPADTRRMAWTLPVADGYGAPAFEQIVLFHIGGWSVRYKIACAAEARDTARKRILAFMRWIRSNAE